MIAVVLRALARNLRNETKTYYSSLQRLASPNKVERIEPLQVRDICVYPLPEISLRSISGYQKFVLRTNFASLADSQGRQCKLFHNLLIFYRKITIFAPQKQARAFRRSPTHEGCEESPGNTEHHIS